MPESNGFNKDNFKAAFNQSLQSQGAGNPADAKAFAQKLLSGEFQGQDWFLKLTSDEVFRKQVDAVFYALGEAVCAAVGVSGGGICGAAGQAVGRLGLNALVGSLKKGRGVSGSISLNPDEMNEFYKWVSVTEGKKETSLGTAAKYNFSELKTFQQFNLLNAAAGASMNREAAKKGFTPVNPNAAQGIANLCYHIEFPQSEVKKIESVINKGGQYIFISQSAISATIAAYLLSTARLAEAGKLANADTDCIFMSWAAKEGKVLYSNQQIEEAFPKNPSFQQTGFENMFMSYNATVDAANILAPKVDGIKDTNKFVNDYVWSGTKENNFIGVIRVLTGNYNVDNAVKLENKSLGAYGNWLDIACRTLYFSISKGEKLQNFYETFQYNALQPGLAFMYRMGFAVSETNELSEARKRLDEFDATIQAIIDNKSDIENSLKDDDFLSAIGGEDAIWVTLTLLSLLALGYSYTKSAK